jgi:peptidoglycan/LPS O-acetylase OafA/YrhL
VFFTISGFVVTNSIWGDLSHNAFSLKSFYTRRAKRLSPALLLVLATMFAFRLVRLSDVRRSPWLRWSLLLRSEQGVRISCWGASCGTRIRSTAGKISVVRCALCDRHRDHHRWRR